MNRIAQSAKRWRAIMGLALLAGATVACHSSSNNAESANAASKGINAASDGQAAANAPTAFDFNGSTWTFRQANGSINTLSFVDGVATMRNSSQNTAMPLPYHAVGKSAVSIKNGDAESVYTYNPRTNELDTSDLNGNPQHYVRKS